MLILNSFARRLQFCRWVISQPNAVLEKILFSDEATFELSGHVNSQNIRQYAPKKSLDPNGRRPSHFIDYNPTFSPKVRKGKVRHVLVLGESELLRNG